ncbi:MAG: hypothetical protein QOJ15_107 [Bradyrhizobium sp.]|jgi:hypothetical protein|nr:hypothetical protein [Bradyrhizobium sp.]
MTDPINRAPFYHDGMRELQDRFDGAARRSGRALTQAPNYEYTDRSMIQRGDRSSETDHAQTKGRR